MFVTLLVWPVGMVIDWRFWCLCVLLLMTVFVVVYLSIDLWLLVDGCVFVCSLDTW